MIPDRIFTPFFEVNVHEWFKIRNNLFGDRREESRTITMYLHDMNDNPPTTGGTNSFLPTLNHSKANVTAKITEIAVGTDFGIKFIYFLDASSPGWVGSDPFSELKLPETPMNMLSLQMIKQWLTAMITVELKDSYMGEIKSPDDGEWWTKGPMDVYDTIRIAVTGESKIKVISVAEKSEPTKQVRASLYNIAVNSDESTNFVHRSDFERINREIRIGAKKEGDKFLPKILSYSDAPPTDKSDAELRYKEALIVYNDFNEYQIDSMVESTMFLVAEGDEKIYNIFKNVMRVLRRSIFFNVQTTRNQFIQFLQRLASNLYYSDKQTFVTLIENNNHESLDVNYTPTNSEDSLQKRFSRIVETLYEVVATSGQVIDYEEDTYYAPKYK